MVLCLLEEHKKTNVDWTNRVGWWYLKRVVFLMILLIKKYCLLLDG